MTQGARQVARREEAKEEAEAAALIGKVAAEKAEKEARKAAKKAEKEKERAAKRAEGEEVRQKQKGEDGVTTLGERACPSPRRKPPSLLPATSPRAPLSAPSPVTSHPARPRDIKINNFSMGMNGRELIKDCDIEITIGRRYGLLGQNGCGKTNFLECLAQHEVPIRITSTSVPS